MVNQGPGNSQSVGNRKPSDWRCQFTVFLDEGAGCRRQVAGLFSVFSVASVLKVFQDLAQRTAREGTEGTELGHNEA